MRHGTAEDRPVQERTDTDPESLLSLVDSMTMVASPVMTHCRILRRIHGPEDRRRDKAVRLRKILLDHDIIEFVVGTRINDAHQDPNLPLELDICRNTVRRICESLERIYMKETKVRYL